MSDTDKPLFLLELNLRAISGPIRVYPTLINDKQLDQIWNMMNACIMDLFDELGEEPTDERFREFFVEVCYRLVYREMFTLHIMPSWEKAELERLGTRERGPGGPRRKKGSYDDDWHSH